MKTYKILFNEEITWKIELKAKNKVEAQELFQDIDLDNDSRAIMQDVNTGELVIEEIIN